MDKKSPSGDSLELRKMEVKEKSKKKKKKKELIAEKETMEKKVEELTRLLAEEKQTSRRTIAKLQREVARLKSERNYAQRGESREGLMKELDRERMLRVDAEHRLHDMRIESDSCRSRLQALQDEFRKMEEMVRSMLQYKAKIDQLKQEKTNLAATFEVNLQKSRSQVSELERENMMLLNQVKKLESQMTGKGDDQDKSKVLLQRLKMLEAENSALVLENEQQRQQYEKCLDEIANQVVQALLAQKTLREECMKLQTRVHDLEHQNRQLNHMFQQRLRYSNQSGPQSHSSCQPPAKIYPVDVKSAVNETNTTQTTASPATTTTPHPPHTQPQVRLPHHNRQPDKRKQRGATPEFLENSTESIQSMCSDYMFDDSPGKPQMSSPPPWLREKLDKRMEDGHLSRSSTESPSSIPSSASPVSSLSSSSTPTTAAGEVCVGVQDRHKSKSSPALQTKIETEFPVNNQSPKVKHINLSESGSKSLDRRQMHPGKVLTKPASRLHKRIKNNKTPVNGGSPTAHSKIPTSSKGTPVLSANQIPPQRLCDSPKLILANPRGVNVTRSGSPQMSSRGIPVLSANALPRQRSCESPKEQVSNGVRRQSCDGTPDSRIIGPKHSTPLESSKLRQVQTSREGSPKLENSNSCKASVPFRSQYYYDYSDEDSDCRPVNPDCDTESTMSLNELLDNSMDNMQMDDDFLSDWSPICLSPTNQNVDHPLSMTPQGMFFNMSGGKPVPIVESKSGPYATIIVKEGRSIVVDEAYGLAGCRPLRPDNLILVPRDKQFTSCGFSSSSSSAEDAKSFVSTPMNKLETCEEHSSEANSGKFKQNENLNDSDTVNCVNHPISSAAAVDVGEPNSSPVSERCSKDNFPKTSTPIMEHVSENKTKASSSKIPLMSPTSAKKAPPPVPRKPKLQKALSPVSPLQASSPPSETNVKCEKSTATSSNTFSPVSAESSSPDSPKPQLPISENNSSKSGLPISEKHCKSGLPINENNSSKSGLPIIEKHSKSGLPISEKHCKSGLPISEKHSKSGLPISEKYSKSGLPVGEKIPQPGLSIGEKSCAIIPVKSREIGGKNLTATVNLGPTVKLGPTENVSPVKGSDKVNGLVLDKNGLPYLCENLTVERQRDLAAFLVQDVIERVKNQEVTIYQHKCQSSDSSFESVRVERSGSKDDGYSTMSSDIQPEVLKEFADHTAKSEECACEHDCEKLAESVLSKVKGQLQDLTSDPDSAMENSMHSCEMRTSSHSLSSQLSTSSGEGLLSPGHKVQNMKKFFEEAAKKTSGSEESDRSPVISPQSPIVNCHSELGKISKIPIFQQSPLSQLSSKVSQDNKECSKIPLSQTSMQNSNIQSRAKETDQKGDYSNSDGHLFDSRKANCSLSEGSCNYDGHLFDSRKANCSLSEGNCNSDGHLFDSRKANCSLSEGSCNSDGHLFDSRKANCSLSEGNCNSDGHLFDSRKANCSLSEGSCNYDGHLFDSRKANCSLSEGNCNSDGHLFDSRKANCSLSEGSCNSDGHLFDSRKANCSLSEGSCNSSEDDLSLNDGSVLATDIFYQDVSGSSSKDDSGLGHMTSLHISEEKILEDIPEDDEWEVLHNKNLQEHFHDQYTAHHYSASHAIKDSSSMETVRPLSGSSITSITQPLTSPTLASVPCMCLMKAKSETELSSLRHPRTTSKYEDFLDGNWDSGKVPERSASVSEMDTREPAVSDWQVMFRRKVILLNVNENAVLCRVHSIINRLYSSQTCLSVDSDTSGERIPSENFLEKWKEKEKRPYNLPVWNPKQTMETFLKNSTPSPVSVTKFDSSNAEDWLLQFSKDDIDRHLNASDSHATNGNRASLPTQDNVKHLSNHTSNRINSHETTTSQNRKCGEVSSNETHSFDSFDRHQFGNCSNKAGNMQTEEVSDDGCQSPSVEQTQFNSRFYSLCPVGPDSKSSLFSHGSQDGDINKILPTNSATKCQRPSRDSIESKEFEVISRQIADLSKTVSELHHSLSSLNSDIGSTDNLQNYLPCSSVVSPNNVLDGYHWEADEIFMTSCGGEVIIGSSDMISTGDCDWMNDSMEENGASCLLHSDSVGDIPEHFYEIQFNGSSSLNGHFSRQKTFTANGHHSLERAVMANGRNSAENGSCLLWEKRASLTETSLEDPMKRANLLDSMLESGGESNDSLASDIGLDHIMSQRLMGCAGKPSANHFPTSGHLPVDFSKFFIRYGEQEEQAVAAFDFLDEFSSPSNSESPSMQQRHHHQPSNDDVKSVSPPVCPSVCVVNCRIDSSGRVRRTNRRKKRGDARKEQKQRENDARSHIPRYCCEQNSQHISSDSVDFLPGESLSLSDSCHESFSSSSPTFNNVTML